MRPPIGFHPPRQCAYRIRWSGSMRRLAPPEDRSRFGERVRKTVCEVEHAERRWRWRSANTRRLTTLSDLLSSVSTALSSSRFLLWGSPVSASSEAYTSAPQAPSGAPFYTLRPLFPRWFHFTISDGTGHMRRRIPDAIVPRDCSPASGVGRKAESAVLRLIALEGFRNDHQGDGESSAAVHCEPQMDLIDPDPQGHVARLETRSKSASLPTPAKSYGAAGCRASRYEMHNTQPLVR